MATAPKRAEGVSRGLALRLGWRDAIRHPLRSLLVVFLIAAPLALATGALAVTFSHQPSPEARLPVTVGGATARLAWEGAHVVQVPDTESQGFSDGPVPALPGVAPGAAPTPEDIARVVGGRVIPLGYGVLDVAGRPGRPQAVGLDATDPITQGMTRLVAGRYPAGPGEVAVTPRAVREGMPAEGTLVLTRGARVEHYRIVGVAEAWTPDGRPADLLLPYESFAYPAGSTSRTFLLDRAEPMTWAEIRRPNEQGFEVLSPSVLRDPPPREELDPRVRAVDPGLSSKTVVGRAVLIGVLPALAGALGVALGAAPFAIIAGRQRRTLALLAAQGAPPDELWRIVAGQALALGGGAALAGPALGLVGALVLAGSELRYALDLTAAGIVPSAELGMTVGFVALAAVAAAVCAAWLTTRGLGGLGIAAVLRGGAGAVGAPPPRAPRGALTVVAVSAAALVWAAAATIGLGPTSSLAILAIPVLVLALVAATIRALPWLLALLGLLPGAVGSAARAARRHGRASSAVAAALFVTVTVAAAVLVVAASEPRSPARHPGIVLVALAVALVIAGTAAALIRSEQRRDDALLSDLGAGRRTLRRRAASEAAVVAALGTGTGLLGGLLVGSVLAPVGLWIGDYGGTRALLAALTYPWPELLALALLIPPLSAGLAALSVRRR